MPALYEILIRLGLACILGGLIGFEREKTRHPAGLRTHILVCIGSALVMLCSIYMFEIYKNQANIDPARLGAQVISGIGFLGAGTILKEGVTVKGLTTAASLWAVACIGVSIGVGFYSGAVVATAFVLVILLVFSKFEHVFYSRKEFVSLKIKSIDMPGQIGLIGTEIGKMNMSIQNISIEQIDQGEVLIIISTKLRYGADLSNICDNISKIGGISLIEII